DPGFELESRLSKDLNNQYAASRPWGAAWPLPAIHGGSRAAPHGGRYAGLINGDGAQAPNAFVDKFTFKQRAPRVAKAFHVGAYFRIDRVWRARTGTGVWPEPGLRLAVVGGDGSGYFYNPFQDVLIDLPTLAQWAGDGQWHYVYFTMNTPPADNDGQFEIVVRDGEGDADWREPLVDAYVDDLVFAPVDKVPPAALARRVGSGEVRAGDAVSLSAAGSFGFNAGGAALSPGSGLSYAWDLGNGQTASGPAVNTVYGAPGEYVARVTVTDQKGLASTAQVFITVLPATERLAATPSLAHQGDNVLLTLTLTGDGGPLTAALPLPAELNYVSHTATCAPAPAYDAGARQLTYAGQPAAGAACQIAVTTQVATSQVRALTVAATFSKSGGPAQPLTVDLLLNPVQVWLPSVSR
ncbi:MAG: PKD domain-containing protein, partial [Anaerolineales bacterium]|nr:PKD domain-containing protein [Anaerolineales bacterium]